MKRIFHNYTKSYGCRIGFTINRHYSENCLQKIYIFFQKVLKTLDFCGNIKVLKIIQKLDTQLVINNAWLLLRIFYFNFVIQKIFVFS